MKGAQEIAPAWHGFRYAEPERIDFVQPLDLPNLSPKVPAGFLPLTAAAASQAVWSNTIIPSLTGPVRAG